jgi:hypothetical protein
MKFNWIIIPKIISFLLLPIVVVACLTNGIYNSGSKDLEMRQVQEDLEHEWRAIETPPSTVLTSYHISNKSHQVLVNSTYSAKLNYQEIRAYYDHKLSKQGWMYIREEQVTEWGKRWGGFIAYYCKGKYSASIQYSGNSPNHQWTYALAFSWGFDNCE